MVVAAVMHGEARQRATERLILAFLYCLSALPALSADAAVVAAVAAAATGASGAFRAASVGVSAATQEVNGTNLRQRQGGL